MKKKKKDYWLWMWVGKTQTLANNCSKGKHSLRKRFGTANDGKHIHAATCVISTENVNYFFNRRTVKRCSPGCKRFLLLVISFNLNWLIFQTYGKELHFVAFIRVLLVRLGTSSINYRQFILSCRSWRNILKEQEKISRLPLKAISKQ